MAENLQEFIKCCKSEKIKEASKRSIKEREEILIANGRGDIITNDGAGCRRDRPRVSAG